MEQNPDFSDVEVSERPKNVTAEATVVNVVKGSRSELYPDTDEDSLKYGSMDDELIQLELNVQHKGHTITIYEDMAFYQNPSDRSMFGQYINRYGSPEAGQNVDVTFDDDGEAQVVGIRG